MRTRILKTQHSMFCGCFLHLVLDKPPPFPFLSFHPTDVITSSIVVITTAGTTRPTDHSLYTGVVKSTTKKEATTTRVATNTTNERKTTGVKESAKNRDDAWSESAPPRNTKSTRNTKNISGGKLVLGMKSRMRTANLTRGLIIFFVFRSFLNQ